MELAAMLTKELERLRAGGRLEVREDGAWLAAMEGFRYEFRQRGEVVLLHLWSEQSSLVRRVLRVAEAPESEGTDASEMATGPGSLILEVTRFGSKAPSRFEFAAVRAERSPLRIAREQFRARFRDLLAEQFPDEKITSLTATADLKNSLSGNYTRGLLEGGSQGWAVLGVAPGEFAATCDALLTFGLLWLAQARKSAKRKTAGVRLFFPAGTARVVARRVQALSPSTRVELYEYSEDWRVRRVDPQDMGNLETWLVPRRDVDGVLAQAAPAIERIRKLAPGAIESEAIPGTAEVALRFRGALFARWTPAGVYFGFGDPRTPLEPGNETELKSLVRELETRRSPVAEATKHPWYRVQPERWLQSVVSSDPARIDARIDPRFLYAQVPAFSSRDRGIMDLLCVTRDARLAVLELKASEDIHLVLQAVDYWQRVCWHQARQEFSRYGYFPGVSLDPRPPLLFLVAPSLQFHPANDALLRYLNPEIEICRVGVSESWRRGLKVVLRQGR
jgi:hypothetical protein